MTPHYTPQTLEEALRLLSRPDALPVGGGTALGRGGTAVSLVDLQNLGLDAIAPKGKRLDIGATVRLQTLLDAAADLPALQQALRLEAPPELRRARTVAGALLTSDGRSPFAAVMMALDASVRRVVFDAEAQAGKEESLSIGHLLLERLTEPSRRQLLLGFSIPRHVFLGLAGLEQPLLWAAAARWPSGRTRLVMGGWGPVPVLAMDGPDAGGLPAAARNACYEAAEERREAAPALARKALAEA